MSTPRSPRAKRNPTRAAGELFLNLHDEYETTPDDDGVYWILIPWGQSEQDAEWQPAVTIHKARAVRGRDGPERRFLNTWQLRVASGRLSGNLRGIDGQATLADAVQMGALLEQWQALEYERSRLSRAWQRATAARSLVQRRRAARARRSRR